LLLTVLSLAAVAVDLQADYFRSVQKYFGVDQNDISRLTKSGIDDHDLPVVFFIAQKAGHRPNAVAETRREGKSWMDVCKQYSLDATDFYMIVTGKIKSRTYGPIFDRYKQTPEKKWHEIKLTDTDITNLVNLKMMASLHDYSAYEIMAMRDYGKSFLRINQQVIFAKKKINEKQQQTVVEAR
jgi:hypothetical protein